MLENETLRILEKSLSRLERGFESLPDFEQRLDLKKIEDVMMDVADIMKDNYPYFHPLYAGQMLKPPHPIARIAYMLSLWINPKNGVIEAVPRHSEIKEPLAKRILKNLNAE